MASRNDTFRKQTPLPTSRQKSPLNKPPTNIANYRPSNTPPNYNNKLNYNTGFSNNSNYNSTYNNNSYNTNYSTNRDYANKMQQNKFNRTPASFGLFNYLESPFYAKKMNDPGNRKYRNKLNKQWDYKKRLVMPSSTVFLTGSPSKPADFDYKMNYSYLNQVIPPTQSILEEQSRRPVDLTDIPPPSSFQHSYINDNIETIFTNKPLPNYAGLSNEEARQALIRHVSNNYCLSKSYAKKMTILNIENAFIYTVSLETFSEKRQTSWSYEPYTNSYVDGGNGLTPPPVWDIVPMYDNVKLFRDHVETMVIPHSETIRSCFLCKSSGRNKCEACHGVGFDKCYSINHKIENGEPCFQCEGGRKKCFNCNGTGVVNCKVCLGYGQLKCFLKLTITWKNHVDEYLPESAIPKDRLRFISGDIIYNDTNVKVTPISYLTNRDLSKASEALIRKHEEAYLTQELPIMQRQLIQAIQISTVHYQYKNKLGIFFVFGKQSKVYAPSYPKSLLSCCSCCTII